MDFRYAMNSQRGQVRSRWVALVLRETIMRETLVQLQHEFITRRLGKDGGR